MWQYFLSFIFVFFVLYFSNLGDLYKNKKINFTGSHKFNTEQLNNKQIAFNYIMNIQSTKKTDYNIRQWRHLIPQLQILYLFLNIVIDFIVFIDDTEIQNFTIVKISIDSLLTLLSLFIRNTKTLQASFHILPLISQLTLSLQFIFIEKKNLNILICLLSFNIDNTDQFVYQLAIPIACILIKLLTLIIISIVQKDLSASFTIAIIIILEMNLIYQKQIIKNKQMEAQQNSIMIALNDSSSSKRDNIWKHRIQQIPISVILVSKSDLQITHKNNTVYYQFRHKYSNEDQLNTLIMNELHFSVIQADIHFIQKINQKKKKQIPNKELKMQESVEHFHLMDILQNFKDGKYQNLLGDAYSALELVCKHKWNDGSESLFSCQLITNQEDDEIIIALNDITKQKELQLMFIKDQFKSKIIESFSHELRTPLNSSINYLQAILIEQEIKNSQKQFLIKPALNSLRLQSYLINDIIDFQQYYSSQLQINFEEFPISKLVQEISELFYYQTTLLHLGFEIDLQEHQYDTLITDYSKLIQILINLIGNAIKFQKNGKIIFKISSTNLDENIIKFSVIDEGIGIDNFQLEIIEQNLKNIQNEKDFSSFTEWQGFGLIICQILLMNLAPNSNKQLTISQNTESKGTKVSFYIKQAESSNSSSSTLQKQSKNGHYKSNTLIGTKIIVSEIPEDISELSNSFKQLNSNTQNSLQQKICALSMSSPVLLSQMNNNFKNSNQINNKLLSFQQLLQIEEEDITKIKQNKLNSHSCSCYRILSVDDDIFNQKSIELLIQKLGYNAILAQNGEEAIQKVLSLPRCTQQCKLLSFILMDYQMPIMDGVKTTIALKQLMVHKIIPQIPIYGLTAFTSSQDISLCLQAGMQQVLQKPLVFSDLKNCLKENIQYK